MRKVGKKNRFWNFLSLKNKCILTKRFSTKFWYITSAIEKKKKINGNRLRIIQTLTQVNYNTCEGRMKLSNQRIIYTFYIYSITKSDNEKRFQNPNFGNFINSSSIQYFLLIESHADLFNNFIRENVQSNNMHVLKE